MEMVPWDAFDVQHSRQADKVHASQTHRVRDAQFATCRGHIHGIFNQAAGAPRFEADLDRNLHPNSVGTQKEMYIFIEQHP